MSKILDGPNRAGPDQYAAAEELIRRLFVDAGWKVRAQVRLNGHEADLAVSRGKEHYVVEIKAVSRGSSVPLEQPWSMACLKAMAGSDEKHKPLAVVVAPQVSEAAARRLQAYQRDFAPDVAIGIVDSRGYRYFDPPALHRLNAEPLGPHKESLASNRASAPNLFSDLNQWLMKVLLAPELKPGVIGSPQKLCRNATELANSGDCSIMSAHRFIEELKSEGFLDEGARHLRLVRREQLFKRWLSAKSHVQADASYRMVIRRDLRQKFDHYFSPLHACLGLFAAADELGVGFVSGVPPYVLVDRPSVIPGGPDALKGSAELIPVEKGEPADLIVRVPKARKSVMRGVVKPRGTPCSDVIQTWLDVSNHGSRGEEQAALIWKEHLGKLVAAE